MIFMLLLYKAILGCTRLYSTRMNWLKLNIAELFPLALPRLPLASMLPKLRMTSVFPPAVYPSPSTVLGWSARRGNPSYTTLVIKEYQGYTRDSFLQFSVMMHLVTSCVIMWQLMIMMMMMMMMMYWETCELFMLFTWKSLWSAGGITLNSVSRSRTRRTVHHCVCPLSKVLTYNKIERGRTFGRWKQHRTW